MCRVTVRVVTKVIVKRIKGWREGWGLIGLEEGARICIRLVEGLCATSVWAAVLTAWAACPRIFSRITATMASSWRTCSWMVPFIKYP